MERERGVARARGGKLAAACLPRTHWRSRASNRTCATATIAPLLLLSKASYSFEICSKKLHITRSTRTGACLLREINACGSSCCCDTACVFAAALAPCLSLCCLPATQPRELRSPAHQRAGSGRTYKAGEAVLRGLDDEACVRARCRRRCLVYCARSLAHSCLTHSHLPAFSLFQESPF